MRIDQSLGSLGHKQTKSADRVIGHQIHKVLSTAVKDS